MSKVTSKLQVTIPKALADRYRLKPGDQIDWQPAEDSIRIVPVRRQPAKRDSVVARLAAFDAATARQAERQRKSPRPPSRGSRGWTREELYDRGNSR